MITKDFIEKAKQVHGDRYDYSKVEYKGCKEKVCIICPVHGEFLQVARIHLMGCGCKKCHLSNETKTTEQFIAEAKKVHGDKYDYSKVEYVNAKTKICIICPLHGEFWQTPNDHLSGKGCKICKTEKIKGILTKTTEQFIAEAKKVHGDKYDYSKVEYLNSHTKICIICKKHGEFWQMPYEHLNGKGCKICRESRMEKLVAFVLKNNNINFIQQKKFEWLGLQSLDFYLPKYNIAIECQGIQHYKPVSFGSSIHTKDEMFELVKKRDKIKKELCLEHGIKIIYFSTEVCASNVIKNENNLLKEIKKYDI
jgi:very-short-patch-repair endonuclease